MSAQDSAVAAARGSNADTRKRTYQGDEYRDDYQNGHKRHNFGNLSLSTQPRPELPLSQQPYHQQHQSRLLHHYQQQPQMNHQALVASSSRRPVINQTGGLVGQTRRPITTRTRGHQEFPVPAQSERFIGPRPAYPRHANTGTRVVDPAPGINSNMTINRGTSMGSLFGVQVPGAGRVDNSFGHGMDGNGFSCGNDQASNGLTFGAVPRAYQSHTGNGYRLPNSNNMNGANIANHTNNGYTNNTNGHPRNTNVLNGGAMRPVNGVDYSSLVDNATIYNDNMPFMNDFRGTTGNVTANSFNGGYGNSTNGSSVGYGQQNSFFDPPVNYQASRNPNLGPQIVHIATGPRRVHPTTQPVLQSNQNVQNGKALNHHSGNYNVNSTGHAGNGNRSKTRRTTAPVQQNGLQPEMAMPIPLHQPLAIPAAEPTPAPTPADP